MVGIAVGKIGYGQRLTFWLVWLLGFITELVYSILHGPKSCNIKYGQWLALQVVKSNMDRGWHGGW